MTPKDIVNILLIVAVVVIAINVFFVKDTSLKDTIRGQQRVIDSLRNEVYVIKELDSIRSVEDSVYLQRLDSITETREKEDSLLMVQIKLLWKNNYALRKDYDSAFNSIPDLPDF